MRLAVVRYWKRCGYTCAPSSPTAPFQPTGKQRFQAVVSQGASPDLLPSLSWLLGVSVTLRALSSRSAGFFHARANLFPWHSSSTGLCCAQGCGMSQACQLLLATAVSYCCRGTDPGRAPATPSLLPSSLSHCNLLDLE